MERAVVFVFCSRHSSQRKRASSHQRTRSMTPPRVVIAGGGQGGVGVAQALHGKADVTLVDGCVSLWGGTNPRPAPAARLPPPLPPPLRRDACVSECAASVADRRGGARGPGGSRFFVETHTRGS